VRTFALRQDELTCRPPIAYGEHPASPFYSQALEVYSTVNTIRNPTPGLEDWAANQRWAAIFWSDDILNLTFAPPPRLIAILNQVVANEDSDLAEAAEAYAKMGLALSDAGVALWNSKYVYNVERPVSYIRRVMSQQYPEAANWETILDATAVGGMYGVTPAFPAYPSGHSGFGGCGGKILSSMFEYNAKHPGTYTFTDLCHQLRTEFLGTPRVFTSFAQAGEENAYSRIPLGVGPPRCSTCIGTALEEVITNYYSLSTKKRHSEYSEWRFSLVIHWFQSYFPSRYFSQVVLAYISSAAKRNSFKRSGDSLNPGEIIIRSYFSLR
jgi:hypothetical protein